MTLLCDLCCMTTMWLSCDHHVTNMQPHHVTIMWPSCDSHVPTVLCGYNIMWLTRNGTFDIIEELCCCWQTVHLEVMWLSCDYHVTLCTVDQGDGSQIIDVVLQGPGVSSYPENTIGVSHYCIRTAICQKSWPVASCSHSIHHTNKWH